MTLIAPSKVAILRARRGYASVLELFAGSGLRAARYLAEGRVFFLTVMLFGLMWSHG